jgi:hypothetical protein
MLIRNMVSWALGPSGTNLLDWYVAHNLLVNGLIVTIGLLAIIFPRQRDRVKTILNGIWQKTPFALSAEEREALERAKARQRAKYERNRKEEEK